MTGPTADTDPVIPEPILPPAYEPPPFWGRWLWLYVLVLALLVAETVAFSWLTGWAS